MPLIEELPVTQLNRASHGWAYVPDTGVPIAAMTAGGRKRGAPRDADNRLISNNPSVKQQKATLQRLERLGEENWSKQAVPLPARSRMKKSTQNVRRILASERQFKHWHDEQVAQLALGGSTMVARAVTPAPSGARQTSSLQPQGVMQPPPLPKPSTPRIKTESSAPASSSPLVTTSEEPIDPLLVTHGVPKVPSKRLMDILLAEPPLSYDAAIARPLEKRLPLRHFCTVCGYWGKVRCKRCGERTCGLMDCWKGHEASCAVPAY